MRTNTPTKNKERRWKPISSRASTKLTPYPSSEISNKPLKNIAEEHSAQTVISWDIGEKTVVSTNAPTATSINPITKNISASFDLLDLMADPNPYQTRISVTTTPPRLNSLSERIQNQETCLPSYISNHLFLVQRENHQKQGKRQKEELLHPRTKKGQKRDRPSLR